MSSPEIYYLHINGEQRGPYTIPQIDHLLNSGLITEDALYLREGMEQWQPVTDLVRKRKRRHPLRWLIILACILVPLTLLALFFGPITMDGWREMSRRDFSAESAYWRARETVRNMVLPKDALVRFDAYSQEQVQLTPQTGAKVHLRGEVSGPDGKWQPASWEVALGYNTAAGDWSGLEAKEIQGE